MTHLCVPIFVTELAKARRDVAAAAAAGADMVELRIDTLADTQVLTSLLEEKTLPAIVTCRPTWDGGLSKLDDFDRAMCLATALVDGAQYVDFELKTAQKSRDVLDGIGDDCDQRVILSFHDFSGKPAKVLDIIQNLNQLPASVNKIVWKAKGISENIDALNLLKNSKRLTIALCMGEAGLVSRVLAKKFGAFLTFASLDDESATAPGQVTVADMKRLYRWDAVGPRTKVYGVVAHPVRHSMSPAIHNAAFSAVGHDGIYLPMLVEPDYESFKRFIGDFLNFDGMDLSGLSVTIPHKANALRYLKEKCGAVEELAERIGAVNTITIRREGKVLLSGKNTDYAAILDSITAELGIGRDGLRNLNVAVLGAGGTGRAAVAALAHFGAKVTIANRTQERAKVLADEFKVATAPMDDLCRAEFDVWINTTSVGMSPNVNESPFGNHPPRFSAKTIVFDTVYNPIETRLLEQAERAGARTIGGVEMFVRQAAAQFETWTGKPAPRDLMRQTIVERLG